MSLFIGKNNANRAIMHITNLTNDYPIGDPNSSTVFHSDLPFISYTTYDCTLRSVSVPSDRGLLAGSNQGLQVSDECVNLIKQGRLILIEVTRSGVKELLDSNAGILYDTGSYYEYTYAYCIWANSTFTSAVHYQDDTFYYPIINTPNGVSSAKIHVLNIGQYTVPGITSNGVSITASSLFINSTDVANYQYLSPVTINSTDPVIPNVNGHNVQFINYVQSSSGIEVYAAQGVYQIKTGGKTIFDSSALRKKLVYGSTTILHIPNNSYCRSRSGTSYIDLDSGFSNGDMVAVYRKADSGATIQIGGLFTFVGGTTIALEVAILGAVNVYGDIYTTYVYLDCTSSGVLRLKIVDTFYQAITICHVGNSYYVTRLK